MRKGVNSGRLRGQFPAQNLKEKQLLTTIRNRNIDSNLRKETKVGKSLKGEVYTFKTQSSVYISSILLIYHFLDVYQKS